VLGFYSRWITGPLGSNVSTSDQCEGDYTVPQLRADRRLTDCYGFGSGEFVHCTDQGGPTIHCLKGSYALTATLIQALAGLRILERPFCLARQTKGLEDSPNPGPRFGIVPTCRPAFRRSRRVTPISEI